MLGVNDISTFWDSQPASNPRVANMHIVHIDMYTHVLYYALEKLETLKQGSPKQDSSESLKSP